MIKSRGWGLGTGEKHRKSIHRDEGDKKANI